MFLVPKPGQPGEWRFIFDGRELNDRIAGWRIRLEGLRDLPHLLRPGDEMVKIDLVSGFFHFRVSDDSRQYLCVTLGGKMYQYNVLPMGMKPSTAIMTKIMRDLLAKWRRQGMRIVHCVDDLLLMAQPGDIARQRDIMLQDLIAIDFHVNWQKSALKPGTLILFLGMLVDSKLQRIFVPQHKADEAVKMAEELASDGELSVKWARALSRLVGKLVAMAPGLQAARIGTRTLHALQQAITSDDVKNILLAEPQARLRLLWWAQNMPFWHSQGVPIFRDTIETTLQLIHDGSVHGWGGRFSYSGETDEIRLDAQPGDEELFDGWREGEGEREQGEREFLTLLILLPQRAGKLKKKCRHTVHRQR
jgi:hypothetical protein